MINLRLLHVFPEYSVLIGQGQHSTVTSLSHRTTINNCPILLAKLIDLGNNS